MNVEAALPGGQAASGWISEVPTVSTDHVIQLANGLVCADSPSVTDIDGNVYPVVSIGGRPTTLKCQSGSFR